MRPQYKFFVYDWNPNGTNDIEIVDAKGRVVNGIPEALFGVNVDKLPSYSRPVYNDPYQGNPCFRISKKRLLKAIACSPVDPNGDSVMAELKVYL